MAQPGNVAGLVGDEQHAAGAQMADQRAKDLVPLVHREHVQGAVEQERVELPLGRVARDVGDMAGDREAFCFCRGNEIGDALGRDIDRNHAVAHPRKRQGIATLTAAEVEHSCRHLEKVREGVHQRAGRCPEGIGFGAIQGIVIVSHPPCLQVRRVVVQLKYFVISICGRGRDRLTLFIVPRNGYQAAMQVEEIRYDGARPVDGYGPGYFRVGGQRLDGAVIVTATEARVWQGPDDTAALVALAGRVDVILFGSGATMTGAPPELTRAVEAAGMGVEPMASPQACRSYNILLAEGRRVALAALPV